MIRLFSSSSTRPKRPSARVPMSRARGIFTSVTAVVLMATLSACASESGNETDVVNQGYQSGDGSVRTWDPNERTQPVVLTGTDYEGNAVDTSAMDGDILVLNTWYAACPPCRAEAGDLLEISQEREADGVQLLGINRVDDAGAALAFEREFDITWPSIDDKNGKAIATLAGVVPIKAVPTTLVLDREGRVAARVLGQIDKSILNTLIDDVVAESELS